MAIPNKAQMAAFGALIHHYASAETGLKICLSGILDQELSLTLVLTEPYTALQLRNVIKSVAKMHVWRKGELDRLIQIVGDLGAHAPLRNHIAHSRWTKGNREGAIKPRGIDIRSGKVVFIGDEPDETDWTTEELQASADKVQQINARILQFNQDTGLTKRIERKIAARRPDKSEASGYSNSDSE